MRDAGAGRQRARRAWCTTRCTTRSGRRSGCVRIEDTMQALACSRRQHGRHVEPGRHGRAGGAHLARRIDPAFAGKCLAAAEKAWEAAKKQPGRYAASKDDQRRRPYDDDLRQGRVLLGGRRALRHHGRAKYLEDLESQPAQQGASGDGDGDDLACMTWQDGRCAGRHLAWRSCRASSRKRARGKPRERLVAAADAYLENQSARRATGLPFAPAMRRSGLPLGLELVRASTTRSCSRWPTTSPASPKYRDARCRGYGLHPGHEPARPVVRHRLRREPAEEPAPPLLGQPGARGLPGATARRPVRAGPTQPAGSLRAGRRAGEGLRAAEVLPRQHRGLVRPTRSRSTGTRRSRGSRRSSTSRARASK